MWSVISHAHRPLCSIYCTSQSVQHTLYKILFRLSWTYSFRCHRDVTTKGHYHPYFYLHSCTAVHQQTTLLYSLGYELEGPQFESWLLQDIFSSPNTSRPISVAVRSKAWVCGRSPAEIVSSKPAGGHGCLSVVSVECCQVEVSAMSWPLVQRSPTDCGASLCVI